MSCSGYFRKIVRELRMPRRDPNKPDELGISSQGRVLCGDLTVQVAQRLSDIGAYRFQNPEGPHQRAYDGLDPVLKSHLQKPAAAKTPQPPSPSEPEELPPEEQSARTTTPPDCATMPQSVPATPDLAHEIR